MTGFINKFKSLFKKKRRDDFQFQLAPLRERDEILEKELLKKDLEKNIDLIKKYSGGSVDIIIRTLSFAGMPAACVFLDGQVNTETLGNILRSIIHEPQKVNLEKVPAKRALEVLTEKLLLVGEISQENRLAKIFSRLFGGETLILVAGVAEGLLCDTRGPKTRAIDEPEGETNIRGPREGFVENLRINTSLLRRRIRSPHLWIDSTSLGKITKTDVAIVYLKGIAREELIAEVKTRLEKINIDGILESGTIEEFITDDHFTPFPLIFRTERPDIITAGLLEGKVAILTDGTPFALLVPMAFEAMLQSPDDYYENPYIGSLIRILRMLSYISSILLPGLYVAVVNFHPALLPSALLLRIVATRQEVPFPVIFEVIFLQLIFEVLREAGLRLPRAIGSAISIVGALILGEAAIQASLVSPMVVIVIAGTAIASFTVPAFNLGVSARILIFFFIILGGVFGLFGIQVGVLLLLVHLTALRSFGQPYMYPLAPMVTGDLKDSLVRTWWWFMNTRPQTTAGKEPWRQDKK